MIKIVIRKVKTPKDARGVEAICFPSDDRVVEGKWVHWWVAYFEGEPVGFATAEECAGKGIFLSRAGVLEKVRGMGIQKRLIRAREAFARRKGNHYVFTYTLINNSKSINSLISRGYKAYRPQNAWVGKNVLYWRKTIGN